MNSKFKTQNSKFSRGSEGVALVVTLILLAVTLVMAVAFLAISRRERGSVTTQSDTTTAKQASDAALALAEAQIASDIFTSTNPYISRLYVTTNYVDSGGFTSGVVNPFNVNYNGYPNNGGALSPADSILNIGNLFYSPAPPVYATNLVLHTNELQFYLDLNRNGRYDTNGLVTNLDVNLKGLGTTNLEVGDPEWIGILEHPDAPHGPNNRFIARYCFIAVPADSIDLNTIHNQVLDTPRSPSTSTILVYPNASGDSYFRDQGVGTWEMNLAGFLADVNADRWGQVIGTPGNPNNNYYYFQYIPPYNAGLAFNDAQALIAWRYNNNYNSLDNPDNIFGNPAAFAFANNGIDGFGLQRQITFDTNWSGYLNPALPWPGANNPNTFFSSPSELFDTNRSSIQFVTSLIDVGSSNATYDRYTFYRLLSQMGTDSRPESGKLNVNYSNAIVACDFNGVMTNFSFVPGLETNTCQWQPQAFFTAAANLLLHAYTAEWYQSSPSNYLQTYYGITTPNYLSLSGVGVTNVQFYPLNNTYTGQTNQIPDFGITNIPVLVNGSFVYTPAVNRLLQLAANIYDASTNKSNPSAFLNPSGSVGVSNYPSVFRPVFWVTNEFSYAYNRNFTNIYIKGYQYIPYATNGTGDTIFDLPVELTDLQLGINQTNVWGVPWILGAKKGFPSLDKAEIESSIFVERLLQFNRNTNSSTASYFPFGRTYTTNQMYIMGISNYFGLVDANTYSENYGSSVSVVARDSLQMGMVWTNENNDSSSALNSFFSAQTNILSPWPAHYNTMLLGTNLYEYFLTAGGASIYGFDYPFYTVPTLLNTANPANVSWLTTNSGSFVYFDAPRSVNFPGTTETFNGPCFIPTFLDPSNFLDSGTPPMSQMYLSMTNRMQVFIVDSAGGILDYVQLGGMSSTVNINTNIADESQYVPGNTDLSTYQQGLWSTNPYYGGNLPYGIYKQFIVSSINGQVPSPPDGDGGVWAKTPIPGTSDTTPPAQQAYFSAFFTQGNQAPYAGGFISNTVNSIQAPFTPIRVATQRFVFEANDPLVHYLASDMNDHSSSTNSLLKDQPILSKLSSPNDRYAPWAVRGQSWPGSVYYDVNPFNLAYKDPLVYSPDNWDFPTNKYPTIGWLGRVHRGTPWQTVYLKSTNLLELATAIPHSATVQTGLYTWQLWSGDQNAYDAVNAAPVQDRILFDLFTATPYENSTRGQLSINVGASDPDNNLAGLAAWSALLSGVVVLSNSVDDLTLERVGVQAQAPLLGQNWPSNTVLTVQPAGLSGFNSPLGQIVQSINLTRRNFVNIDSLTNVFEHVGDILSVPFLSDASPFLNTTNDFRIPGSHISQITNGISDEMYEWLPQQVMSLLTVSGRPQTPPRYVVYCYGQTLKPAANGIVANGTFFGLCTNYQVMAEFGARAVIRVDNAPTPANPGATPHAVIEQYNPLPPD
jgi:hypothetical protein